MPLQGSFLYASSRELSEILPIKYDVLTLDDPAFEMFPIDSVNADKVEWDQLDSTRGLLNAATAGGPYGVVPRKGITRFEARTGYYRSKLLMDEEMLTKAAEIATWGDAIDITKLQAQDQDQLLTIACQRIKTVIWSIMTTGAYSCLDANGLLAISDTAALTPFTTAVAWSSLTTATPLFDLRQLKLRHLGQSATFGRGAKLYLNSVDVNSLLSNANLNDLGAKLRLWLGGASPGSQPFTLADVNSYLMASDLIEIVEWDDNYLDANGVATRYIATGFGVAVGKRLRGEPVGKFLMTRNPELMMAGGANGTPNGRSMGGALSNLYYDFEFMHKPLLGESAMSFNGGPAIYFPGAVVPFRPSGGGSDA